MNIRCKSIKKIIILIMVLVISISSLSFPIENNVVAANRVDGIDAFPESYQRALRELSAKHPNWTFTALYTGLNWEDVLNGETTEGKSLVPNGYDDWWKRDNSQVESGWVNASREAVRYAMNPINFLDEQHIFQFETLSYNASIQNVEGVEGILYGTKMSNKEMDYFVDPKDTSKGKTKDGLAYNKYSEAIFEAGKKYGVSPYHLASRIRQETGGDLDDNLSINGKYYMTFDGDIYDYRGYYNFYNIGASGAHPIANGLKFASTPPGPSDTDYLEPWNNPEKAIMGGAKFISNGYINKGQNTLYFQKFNVVDTSRLYSHQYMTNIFAPSNEAVSVFNAYKNSGTGAIDFAHNFTIPVYNNVSSEYEFKFNSLQWNSTTGKVDVSGYLLVKGINNNLSLPTTFKFILVNSDNGDSYEFPLETWNKSVYGDYPRDLGVNNGAWFRGSIPLADGSKIPQGNYTAKVNVKIGDFCEATASFRNVFAVDMTRKVSASNGRGILFRTNYYLREVPLEIFIRDNGLISNDSQLPTLDNMFNSYSSIGFDGSKLNIKGTSFNVRGDYSISSNVERKIILENTTTFQRITYDSNYIDNGDYKVVLRVPDGLDKTRAWFNSSIDLSSLDRGTYAIYMYTKSGNGIQDYGELTDVFYKDLSQKSTTFNGKTARLSVNQNKRYRIELVIS